MHILHYIRDVSFISKLDKLYLNHKILYPDSIDFGLWQKWRISAAPMTKDNNETPVRIETTENRMDLEVDQLYESFAVPRLEYHTEQRK